MQVFWFIPTHGDSRYLGTSEGAREVSFDYLKQVAVAADTLGYEGVLIPTGRSCEDPWVAASALAAVTQRLKFLVAVRPGLMAPTLAARMAATFDRISNGRLLINLVTGGDTAELEGDGLFLDHTARYEASAEFLRIWRQVLAASHDGDKVDFEGKHLSVKGATVLYPPLQQPHPPVYFGGSSAPAHALAGEQVDTYLTWGEPPADVAQKLDDVRRQAARHGRTVKFGIRLHVIVRETEAAAWAAADDLISRLDDETVARAQAVFAKMDSEGQRRMAALHACGAGDQPQPVGWRWPGARRCRHRAGGRSAHRGRAHARIRRAGHRHLRAVRLPAPGRGLPLRRTGVPAAAALGARQAAGQGAVGSVR